MTPILGALIGIVATLIIVAVAIVFIVRTRERDDGTPNGSASKISVNTAQTKSVSQLNVEPGTTGSITATNSNISNNKRDLVGNALLQQKHEDEHNPDVVPNKNGIAHCLIKRYHSVLIQTKCALFTYRFKHKKCGR